MTNFTLNQQDTKQMKRCIGDLFAQITTDYQQTKSERRAVAAAFPPSDETFSAIEELELLTIDLRGYANQLQVRDWIENPATAIDSPEEQLSRISPQICEDRSPTFWRTNMDGYYDQSNHERLINISLQ